MSSPYFQGKAASLNANEKTITPNGSATGVTASFRRLRSIAPWVALA